MKKRWETKKISEKDARFLSKGTGIPISIARLLLAIGIMHPQEALQFLKPDFRSLHNPFLMKDMEKAVGRILEAIEKGEKILAHADYDCDGVTTAAMFKEGFKLLGVDIDIYAPNRFTDGYGLNPKNMDKFSREYDLILSGDTGIKAFAAGDLVEEINHADLIVTDHHEPLEGHFEMEVLDNLRRRAEAGEVLSGEYESFLDNGMVPKMSEKTMIEVLYDLGIIPNESIAEIHHDEFIALPKAYAVVNPKRLGDVYPCKSLSGVAVVFKLFQAIFVEKDLDMKPLLNLLDIVAVGLVADLVQQIDKKHTKYGVTNDFEVRTMTAFGIKLMNKNPKPWVKAICTATGIKSEEGELIDGTHLGFRFGPLLNAPGRLKDPTPAVNLILEKDEDKAQEIAKELKKINSQRQEQTSVYKIISEELRSEGEQFYDYGIVVQSDEFHIGIAGLIAGKLCEEYYRPSIALAPVEKDGKIVLKGSARSIAGVSVVEVLGEVQKDIGPFEHGGHEQAAGLTLYPEQFEAFRSAFRKYCKMKDQENFVPLYKYDSEISLDDVMKHDPAIHKQADEYPFMKFLSMLEPYGQENREPIFRANRLKIESFDPIMEGKGYRLTFKTNYGKVTGISFRGGEEILPMYEKNILQQGKCVVDALFAVKINVWNGKKSIQLMIEDLKFDEEEA